MVKCEDFKLLPRVVHASNPGLELNSQEFEATLSYIVVSNQPWKYNKNPFQK